MEKAESQKKEFKARIQPRFLIITISLFIILFGYQFYNFWLMTERRFDAEKRYYQESGKWLSLSLGQDKKLQMAVISGRKEILASEIAPLFQDEKISFILLSDAGGRIIYEKYKKTVSAKEIEKKQLLEKISKKDLVQQEIISSSGKRYLICGRPILSKASTNQKDKYLGEIILGLDLGKIYQARERARLWQITTGVISIMILGLVLFYLLRKLIKPVQEISQVVKKIGEGDFSIDIPVKSNDEIGLLAQNINEMKKGLQEHSRRLELMIRSISETIETLSATTSEISEVVSQQAAGATEQAVAVQEAASTSKEIAVTAGKIAQSSEEVSKIAEETSEFSKKGKEFMEKVMEGMELVKDRVTNVSQHILELGEQSQQIGSLINIINEISEQTNLLALNAAIEAAGAGEAGRRFSVVAGEVRRLAGRTIEATQMVREMVETIQNLTNQVVMLSEDQLKTVDHGVAQVREMGNYFDQILERVDLTTQAVMEIRLSTQQQSSASEQMATTLTEIAKVATDSEKGTKDIEQAIEGLNEFVQKLTDLISE